MTANAMGRRAARQVVGRAVALLALLGLAACASPPETSQPTPSPPTPPTSMPSSPSTSPGPPDDFQPAAIPDGVIGATEAEAIGVLAAAGLSSRVVRRDGEDYMVTLDYSPTRVNLSIAEGRVVGANVG